MEDSLSGDEIAHLPGCSFGPALMHARRDKHPDAASLEKLAACIIRTADLSTLDDSQRWKNVYCAAATRPSADSGPTVAFVAIPLTIGFTGAMPTARQDTGDQSTMLINPFDPQQRSKIDEAIVGAKPLVHRTLGLIDRLPAFAEAMRKAKVNGIELLAAWQTWCTDSQDAVIDYAKKHAGEDECLDQLLRDRETKLKSQDPNDRLSVVSNQIEFSCELASAASRHHRKKHIEKCGTASVPPPFDPLGRPQPPNLWGFSNADVFNASMSDRQALVCFWLSQIVRRVQPGALYVDESTVEIRARLSERTHLEQSAATVLGHYDRVSFGYLGLSGLIYRSSEDPLAPKTLIELLDRCLDEIERDLARPEHWKPDDTKTGKSFVPLEFDKPILRQLLKATSPLQQTQLAAALNLKGGKKQKLGERVRLYEEVGIAERVENGKGGTRLTDPGRVWTERWLNGPDQHPPTPRSPSLPTNPPPPDGPPGRTAGIATALPKK